MTAGPAEAAGSVSVDEIVADLEGVAGRWARADGGGGVGRVDVRAAAEVAVGVVEAGARASEGRGFERPVGSRTADAVVVAKQPHLRSARGIGLAVGRLAAFGVEVRTAQRLASAGPREVAAALYPQARRGFERAPAPGSPAWHALGDVFGDGRFATVFGRPFEPAMVVSGAEAIDRFGLHDADLTALWEEGRRPLVRKDVVARYGRRVADAVLGDRAAYDWFRGDWPLGIQRVRSGLVAFALRHERLGGDPIVVLNGHFPGLVALFGSGTWVIDVGLDPDGPSIAEVRARVVGDDNRPQHGEPGSIRRDAADGRFPLDACQPVDARHNLLHCSDGLLAGAVERARLLGQPAGGELVRRLIAGGLTDLEVAEIVMADPIVARDGDERHLTDVTQRQDLDTCVSTIERYVPQVFGAANGHGSGSTFRSFAVAARTIEGLGGDLERFSRLDEARRPLRERPRDVADLDAAGDPLGRAALACGRVGVLVPAGGTGGRFGGYDLAESDPRRQKALAPLLRVAGVERSSLDIRLANVCHWRHEGAPGICPVAVMAGPTNGAAVRQWSARLAAAGVSDIDVFDQHGVYRLRADPTPGSARPGGHPDPNPDPDRWIDAILRAPDGRPQLKPPGSLGLLTAFVLSGGYERWRRRGVDILAIANADDVGARLDPRIVGHVERHALDAVVVAVPRGYRAVTAVDGRTVELRGDAGGWCVDDQGRRWTMAHGDDPPATATAVDPTGTPTAADVTHDVGGVICEVRNKRSKLGWQVAVVEGPAMPGEPPPPGAPFNSNQLYLRCEALDRLLGDDGPVRGAQRLVDALPLYAEHKRVVLTGTETTAVQLLQSVADVLRALDRVGVVRIDRWPNPRQRGGYLPLKRPSDVPFAQRLLDQLATTNDDLRFP